MPIVGIDLGTTNSLVSYWVNDGVKIIPNAFKVHPRDRQENQLLIARGERLFEESLGDLRMEIAAALHHFENVMNRQNDREIKKAAELFRTRLDELEQRQGY